MTPPSPGRTASSARWSVGLGAFALWTLLAGCAVRDPAAIPRGTPEPDRFLFEGATELLKDDDWASAQVMFQRLVDMFPQSPYRFDAKLGLGDTYLRQGAMTTVVQAVNEYDEFLRFYPTNPRADYAQLQIGTAYYEQMLGADRDQTHTRAAIEAFERFFELYPDSDLTEVAQERCRLARDRLSQSEVLVGRFYFDSRWYPGAVQRLRSVLTEDPGFTGRDSVYFMLAEALVALNRAAEALPYFERLVEEFVQSEYLAEAHQRIEQLKGQGT